MPLRPAVSASQLFATSWVTSSSASVMMVAATAPDRAPDRARPRPTTSPITHAASTATTIAHPAPRCASVMPNGASGMTRTFCVGSTANRANVYPAIAPNPMWPNDSTPVLPM